MTSDCCLSTNVWLVSADSILVALAAHQLQANIVTRYQLQVSTTQGRSNGGISVYIPPKSVYLEFFNVVVLSP